MPPVKQRQIAKERELTQQRQVKRRVARRRTTTGR
jgi:hypothetical protein